MTNTSPILFLKGFFYHVLRVPPGDEKNDVADLSGAEILCSIPASDPMKPSYYHSFGDFACHICSFSFFFCFFIDL